MNCALPIAEIMSILNVESKKMHAFMFIQYLLMKCVFKDQVFIFLDFYLFYILK